MANLSRCSDYLRRVNTPERVEEYTNKGGHP